MGGPGRRGDSRSPPRRGGGGGRRIDSRDRGGRGGGGGGNGGGRDRGGGGGGRADSRSRGVGGAGKGGGARGGDRYSPPPRRSRSRGGGRDNRRRSRSRSRSKGRGRGAPREEFGRIPPPKTRMQVSDVVQITDEQKAASIECEGYLYATIDFTPYVQTPPWTTAAPRQYDYQTKTDMSVIRTKTLPKGWELVKAPPEDIVREKVIKIYPWGTHLLVTEGGNAYWSATGENPGAMEAIWDYDKYPGRFALKPRYGRVSTWIGNFLIKTVDKVS